MDSKTLVHDQRQAFDVETAIPDYQQSGLPTAQQSVSYSFPPSPPPEYEQIYGSNGRELRENPSSRQTTEAATASTGTAILPTAIPQLSKGFQNPFESPFVRAYPPALEARGIDAATFLSFMDTLNECFVANPVLSSTQQIGNVIGLMHGVHGELAIAGAVIAGVSAAGVLASSYFRTRGFIMESNRDLFHPLGLHATVLSTKKMCAAVDYPEEKLKLLARECGEDGNGSTSGPASPYTDQSLPGSGRSGARSGAISGHSDVDMASLQRQTSQMQLSMEHAGGSRYPFPPDSSTSSSQALLQPPSPQSLSQPLQHTSSQSSTSAAGLPLEFQKYMSQDYHDQQQYQAAQKAPPSPLANIEKEEQRNWVLMRRMEALAGYVQPLDYMVGAADPSAQSNLFKQINEQSVARKTARQEKKKVKRQQDGEKDFRKALEKTEEVRSELAEELAKMERELRREREKADRKLAGHKASKSESERLKIEGEFEREREKILKEATKEVREAEREIEKELKKGLKHFGKAEKKEHKVTNKVRWLVIREWTTEEQQAESAKEAEKQKGGLPFSGWRRGSRQGEEGGEDEEDDSEINDDVIA